MKLGIMRRFRDSYSLIQHHACDPPVRLAVTAIFAVFVAANFSAASARAESIKYHSTAPPTAEDHAEMTSRPLPSFRDLGLAAQIPLTIDGESFGGAGALERTARELFGVQPSSNVGFQEPLLSASADVSLRCTTIAPWMDQMIVGEGGLRSDLLHNLRLTTSAEPEPDHQAGNRGFRTTQKRAKIVTVSHTRSTSGQVQPLLAKRGR